MARFFMKWSYIYYTTLTVNTLDSQSSGRGENSYNLGNFFYFTIDYNSANLQKFLIKWIFWRDSQTWPDYLWNTHIRRYYTTLTVNTLDNQSSERDRGGRKFYQFEQIFYHTIDYNSANLQIFPNKWIFWRDSQSWPEFLWNGHINYTTNLTVNTLDSQSSGRGRGVWIFFWFGEIFYYTIDYNSANLQKFLIKWIFWWDSQKVRKIRRKCSFLSKFNKNP